MKYIDICKDDPDKLDDIITLVIVEAINRLDMGDKINGMENKLKNNVTSYLDEKCTMDLCVEECNKSSTNRELCKISTPFLINTIEYIYTCIMSSYVKDIRNSIFDDGYCIIIDSLYAERNDNVASL